MTDAFTLDFLTAVLCCGFASKSRFSQGQTSFTYAYSLSRHKEKKEEKLAGKQEIVMELKFFGHTITHMETGSRRGSMYEKERMKKRQERGGPNELGW